MPETSITLYTYFRSSCSARLRIALNLKSLPYTSIPINLLANEQHTPANLARNPSGTVPTLVLTSSNGASSIKITQSLAALEYLDEAFPDTPPLLPRDPATRAIVRTLAAIIACDVQPVTNLKILKRVAELGAQREEWARGLIEQGLRAYEGVISGSAGVYSVGDAVTMADVCLVPAVWGAERFGVDVHREFPVIAGVVARLEGLEAFTRAHWARQLDTPAELRID
ncbi:maleylacetoacetate isomerase MaiA [Aspergillus homomorphus CBS 101889]|uniref:Maleylacetoacetate isomerase n=1 Tax=Aspergillus homomorphus (strain CBS 101889) TaxID=1450537 RepID=A0A395I7P3_ASPHC|nr:Maleylacetoacetate isomerase [Aspergillus homomorphus CBS 101889]RAL15829.1 Maleylacetoacetate isomerase [Aspergillus homomorphus CBS 101889]